MLPITGRRIPNRKRFPKGTFPLYPKPSFLPSEPVLAKNGSITHNPINPKPQTLNRPPSRRALQLRRLAVRHSMWRRQVSKGMGGGERRRTGGSGGGVNIGVGIVTNRIPPIRSLYNSAIVASPKP